MASTLSSFHMCVFFARLLISFTFNPSSTCVFPSHFHNALCITCALSLVALCVSAVYRCLNQREGNVAATFTRFLRSWRSLEGSNHQFQQKFVFCSGISDDDTESNVPPLLIDHVNVQDAHVEKLNYISIVARRLLQKARVDAKNIDIGVVNSSLFNITPSPSAYTVNLLNMGSNMMGWSEVRLAMDFARNPLRVHRNTYAVGVSTANITSNMYFGSNDNCMMVSNAHFRCGCAAILLSNKWGSRSGAKLQFLHCLRTHLGAGQKAYECVQHLKNDESRPGVSLQINPVKATGNTLCTNLTRLPLFILALAEPLERFVGLVRKRVLKMAVKVCDPNFKKAIIDVFAKGQKLTTRLVVGYGMR